MVTIKRRDVHDLVIYLQKIYGLYFIEFREAPNGRKEMVLTKHGEDGSNDKDFWVSIIYHGLTASVIIATFGEYSVKDIENNIKSRKYLKCGKKYQYQWLEL